MQRALLILAADGRIVRLNRAARDLLGRSYQEVLGRSLEALGGRLWLDNLVINGEAEEFSRDPRWDAAGNRRVYETRNVRPRFDFGYSPTHYASGVLQFPCLGRVGEHRSRMTDTQVTMLCILCRRKHQPIRRDLILRRSQGVYVGPGE